MFQRPTLPTPKAKEESHLSSLCSRVVFPGRATLSCTEVAKVMNVTSRHVCDLRHEGTIKAVNVGGVGGSRKAAFWRIPVAAYDAWRKASANE